MAQHNGSQGQAGAVPLIVKGMGVMGRAILAISGSAAGVLNRPIASLWRELAHAMFHRYRPELHYMRGPGPACAAKHGRTQN